VILALRNGQEIMCGNVPLSHILFIGTGNFIRFMVVAFKKMCNFVIVIS